MSLILQVSFIFIAKLPNLLSSNYFAIDLVFWNWMTVQFIFRHEAVKNEHSAFTPCERTIFFLTALVQHQQVILAGQPGVLCQMKAWALQSAPGPSSKPSPQPSHFSSPCSHFLALCSPQAISPHLSSQITLSSLPCQNWQISSPPSPLNRQRCCLHYGCISPFQELAVSLLHGPCQLYHPMCPDLPQPNPALCHCKGKLLHSIF